LASISFLQARAPAFPLMVLLHKLELAAMKACDIRTVLNDSEFQQISDQKSQRPFFKQFMADQSFISIHGKMFAWIYQISVGNRKKSGVLSADMNNNKLTNAIFHKLSLMIKKSLLSKTGLVVHLRKLGLRKESF
jgi:hypothetical protein